MKSYEEMIQFTVDQVDNGSLRYNEWVAYILLGEAYNKTPEMVCLDIRDVIEHRALAKREQHRAANRASNEERRLANLAKKAIQ